MLYQNDTEMLFPPRVIAALWNLRGPEWQTLVEHVRRLPQNHPDVLGFMLMMVRLDGCMTCHARFKGSDRELIARWEIARQDILNWMEHGITPEPECR